jgi:hypothetical protein
MLRQCFSRKGLYPGREGRPGYRVFFADLTENPGAPGPPLLGPTFGV